ncbi:beta-ketoacyl-[acyl-carrier-protein] synthase family protein [Streptomyces sp. TRM 70351]|uniref:beta-ketoacyl-[acyl-carrier-protein] synthase family protein n=1 Tax=Streptomyces sp. TRM 70351 TaxID=3116552 RepID=UPI002E7BAC78|nr:beta-ketoacyl-[acyl-carrier-protein] synthase family protein [Streptomyces sp. TRM 70351]MEE1930427.1 beta-ketoacyl-[acyl-carrier-protein] synthase family protein [Streptomyces sp. TRM 70351]
MTAPAVRRVAVTGLGVLAPGGTGRKNFWQLLTEGRTATRALTLTRSGPEHGRVAAEIDFDAAEHGLAPAEARRMDRAAQFAVVAAREAAEDSGLDFAGLDPARTGVAVGSAAGPVTSLDTALHRVTGHGRSEVAETLLSSADAADRLVPGNLVRDVAWAVGAEGPVTVLSTGCAAGLDAIGHAARCVREGVADVMVAGATEAPITGGVLRDLDAVGVTTRGDGDPAGAARPFALGRDGSVLGEGAAFLVLEELDSARARGAHVYAEIGGQATRHTAGQVTGVPERGDELADAVTHALRESGLTAGDVDYVGGAGTGHPRRDLHDAAALRTALGGHAGRIPVSSVSSMIGDALGAAGALALAASVLAIEHGTVPPTANLHEADPACGLDHVPLTARAHDVGVALTVSGGVGGFLSAMVLTAPGRSEAR